MKQKSFHRGHLSDNLINKQIKKNRVLDIYNASVLSIHSLYTRLKVFSRPSLNVDVSSVVGGSVLYLPWRVSSVSYVMLVMSVRVTVALSRVASRVSRVRRPVV